MKSIVDFINNMSLLNLDKKNNEKKKLKVDYHVKGLLNYYQISSKKTKDIPSINKRKNYILKQSSKTIQKSFLIDKTKNYFLLIFIFFLFFLSTCIAKSSYSLRKLNNNEILLTISEPGEVDILNNIYDCLPNEIYIGNEKYTGEISKTINVESAESEIKLIYYSPPSSFNRMFNGLSKIRKIDFSNFDSSSVTDMEYMFQDCSDLEEINFTGFKTSSVITMEGMFFRCKKLTSLDLSNFETSAVVTMKNMFTACEGLQYLNITNFDTTSVTNFVEMFCDCQSLQSIDISSFSTLHADLGGMFKYCLELQSIKFPETKKLVCTSMGAMFQDCKKLTALNLSCFDTSQVTSMDFVFDNCLQLTSLIISSFNTILVQSLQNMFSNCQKLELLDLSNFDTTYITNYNNMFIGCHSLKYLNLNSFKINEEASISSMFDNIGESLILCSEDMNKINGTYPNLKNDCNETCFSKTRKIIHTTKKCLNDCSEDINFQYEYNNECYNSCPEGTYSSATNIYLCVSTCNNYFNMNKTKCFDEIPEGYFLSDIDNKLIDKCHEKCKTCNQKETLENTNCLTCKDPYYIEKGNCVDSCENGHDDNKECIYNCNIKCKECSANDYNKCTSCNDGYFQKFEEFVNFNMSINCYNQSELENYYLNGNFFYKCFSTCKKCFGEGTMNNHNCDECIDNYDFILKTESNKKNCYEKCTYYYYFDPYDNYKYKCTEKEECKYPYNKFIPSKKKCIENCSKDKQYQYEYNNICYDECPNNTIANNFLCKEKTVEITTEFIEKETSPITQKPIRTHELIKTQEFIKTQEPIKTQITIKTQQFIKTQIITKTEAIKIQTSKIEPLPAITENEKNWSSEKFFLGIYISNEENIISKDEIIKKIREDIINRNLETIISEVVEKKEDKFIKEDNSIFQLTTSENQNNNNYTNISAIKLGECEKILKDKYGLNESETLIILKIDYNITGLLIPIIGYEVFNPRNKSKLNLSYCEKSSINYNIPVSIDEDNLYKYNPNSDYYTDECSTYTTDNGTDILLNDRKEEFSDNNMSLCEKICQYVGYDSENKKALCECGIRYQDLVISDIDSQSYLLAYNFTIDNNALNIGAMKCYELLFSKEGLLTNIGSYILICITVLHLISTFIFYKCGYHIIDANIQEIIEDKKKLKNLEKKSKRKSKIKNKNKKQGPKKSIYSVNQKSKLFYRKSLNLKSINQDKLKKKMKKIKSNPLKKSKKKVDKYIKQEHNLSLNQKSFTKLKVKENKSNTNSEKEKGGGSLKFIFSKLHNEEMTSKINALNFLSFNDFEMNSINYTQALKIDKRTYFEYYLSLIRTKQPIISTFCPVKDFNVLIIKICLFFLSFGIFYFFNTLFFNLSIIHKIYENKGSYDFLLALPSIIYSFILSHIIFISIKYFISAERDILTIKNENTINKANDKVEGVERCLIIKNICYFAISITFLMFFWYYLSSFCALYKNSQVHLIKNTFISFIFFQIYPFFINIIPVIFRRISLKTKNGKCLYNTSKIFQLL